MENASVFRDKFACPRRIDAPEFEKVDYWRDGADRWTGESTAWPHSYAMPRFCSYCGGIHPDDAFNLVVEGWAMTLTENHYKFFMTPDNGEQTPVPHVKLYLMHFSQEQVLRMDDVFRARRSFMVAPSEVKN